MPIVALTREYGSGGTAIAKQVADRLGYEYIRDQRFWLSRGEHT